MFVTPKPPAKEVALQVQHNKVYRDMVKICVYLIHREREIESPVSFKSNGIVIFYYDKLASCVVCYVNFRLDISVSSLAKDNRTYELG